MARIIRTCNAELHGPGGVRALWPVRRMDMRGPGHYLACKAIGVFAPMPFSSRSLCFVAVAVACSFGNLALAEGVDPGAYLAARFAGGNNDFREASHWYTQALIADPTDLTLMDGAAVAHIGAGNMEAAIAVARRLQQAGANAQAGHLALIADQIKREDYTGLIADQKAGRSIGMLLDGLVQAWADVGQGRMSEALKQFDKLAGTAGVEAFGLYHKALALASAGDFEGAEKILAGDSGPLRLMRRGTVAHAQILSQLERKTDAIAVLKSADPDLTDPGISTLLARIEAGEPVGFDITRNVTDGLAEVFFTLAIALNGEASDGYTLLYSRIASYLRPDHAEALLLTGTLLENQRQYELAVDAYGRVPRSDGGFFAAEIGRARSLAATDKAEASIEVLTALTRSHPTLVPVYLALADALRREERWAEATTAYDAAIDLLGTPEPQHWSIYYSRAITLERQKIWDRAEADFRQSLKLDPDQPQVLNYLGYSFLERRENIDEAMAMIERAAAARPDSGYIIDSLAWGMFLLGRYEEAVVPMERASVLEPVDPVVTDHLGDVYWAVGRKLEARFQWRRALSFNPEEKEASRIRRKLDVGLDAVLSEEGASPLPKVVNGN